MSASAEESRSEMFDVCDEHNNVIGQEKRAVVHAKGLYHRAVNVLLFRSDGHLLLQRRAADKDVCPNRWDLSVGEHLKPGEAYADGARRGLKEELGISGAEVRQVRPVHLNSFSYPEAGVTDNEFNELYETVYDGAVEPDGVEVAAVRFAPLGDVLREMESDPDAFTPWCRQELTYRAGLDSAVGTSE
eukprot:CAMPEP_0196770846 /NCGR_PEP_ID=MMETSP1104-20130614/1368_1 /TAXON_ID=33652 /ORGANISM="Cafeteria sp., Strain Caron Lab Isolate" /LENGTH=187 /DNA_ID=CAMNT_0042140961 /DNA_START=66 /DNA_END=629 /DNA_ORIENTATION=+